MCNRKKTMAYIKRLAFCSLVLICSFLLVMMNIAFMNNNNSNTSKKDISTIALTNPNSVHYKGVITRTKTQHSIPSHQQFFQKSENAGSGTSLADATGGNKNVSHFDFSERTDEAKGENKKKYIDLKLNVTTGFNTPLKPDVHGAYPNKIIDPKLLHYEGLIKQYKRKFNITGIEFSNSARGRKYKDLHGESQVNNSKQFLSTFAISNDVTLFTEDDLNIEHYTSSASHPLIPHIIHQTWDNYKVPKLFIPWIKSVLKHHPNWQYWFWTQEDIQCYFKSVHPRFHQLYNSYNAMIYKTDVFRYFILYDYGGVYIDLDVEALKPLDVWTYVASSILSHETYEHSYMVHKVRKRPNVMTTVLASKPQHPYYKLLQTNLLKYHRKYPNQVLESTGPFFLDDIYKMYRATTTSAKSKSGASQGDIFNNTAVSDDDITVIDPKYWLPTVDPTMMKVVRPFCENNKHINPQVEMVQKIICAQQALNNYQNKPSVSESYLNHHWVHTNIQKHPFKTRDTVLLTDILPNLFKVRDHLHLKC